MVHVGAGPSHAFFVLSQDSPVGQESVETHSWRVGLKVSPDRQVGAVDVFNTHMPVLDVKFPDEHVGDASQSLFAEL